MPKIESLRSVGINPLYDTGRQFPAGNFNNLPRAEFSDQQNQTASFPEIIPVQTLVNRYYLENAPLAHSLKPPSQRESLEAQYANTSEHETNHALIARALGIKSKVSLERQGNSLGRTTFEESVSMSTFKIIDAEIGR